MRSVVQSDVKSMNKRMVFDLFRRHKQLTRVEISRHLNMSMPSVAKVVDGFIENGLLTSAGELNTALGRKPLSLCFNTQTFAAVGVAFEGDLLSIGVVGLDGELLLHTKHSVPHRFDMDLADIVAAHVNEVVAELDNRTTVIGIGIGVPGVVIPDARIISFAPLIGIRSDLDASGILGHISKLTGLPVIVENDVNASVIGEAMARSLAQTDDLILIHLGTGLGAGVLLNGTLRRGKNNLCGEIGYLGDSTGWPTSRSRKGYLEGRLNTEALSSLFGYSPEAAEVPPGVTEYVSELLTPHIVNMATLLDVDLIVIESLLAEKSGGELIKRMCDRVNKLALSPLTIEANIANEPGISGIALLAIEERINEYI